ncbi:alcohol dehydrogenase [Thiosulfatimonas sediminis]|uniref:Alcohol dehydrogenase n=2 Tax=Thiosulfatimonas sediminis TaxID=2675054 RepID=A0A6F8PRY4_9GAMM|nr:alcohol dehydrogenase [Thiosulfatimonas sediminis]
MTEPMTAITPFEYAPMPHIHFGWGCRHRLSEQCRQYQHIVVISSRFLAQPGQFAAELIDSLANHCQVQTFIVSGEPSPELVDNIVQQCAHHSDAVIGIGGGSVLDAAKAIAGLLPSQTSVMDYLEGVGAGKPFNVDTCPFIAVPTTAGTGSETTKNAVLSRIGAFKKSFRDNKLLAKAAWLDPELLQTCPKEILHTTGMDAFTQLLESYTTLKSNPMSDALAWQGMQKFIGAFELIDSVDAQQQQIGYGNLMLAAMLSGTTLANAGLGAVHGLAGPIGAFFTAPHGVVCAKLLSPITAANIRALKQHDNIEFCAPFLHKFAQIGRLISQKNNLSDNEAQQCLLDYLQDLSSRYVPQGLAEYGLKSNNIEVVIENCRSGSMLGNPLTLSDEVLRYAIVSSL